MDFSAACWAAATAAAVVCGAAAMAAAADDAASASSSCSRGLTLVHFLAQLESFPIQNTPQTLPNTP